MAKQPPLPFFILHGHEGNVSTLHFSTEEDDIIKIQPTLFSGSDIGEILIWNLLNFRTIFKFSCSEKQKIMFLTYYKSKLFSQSKDGVINIWSFIDHNWISTKKILSESVGFCSSIFWKTEIENEAYISLFNQEKHLLTIYKADSGNELKNMHIKSSTGLCMCLKIINLTNKWFLLTGYENGDIGLWDYETDLEVQTLHLHSELITCLDFDSQLKMRGISGSGDQFLMVWKIASDNQLEKVHQVQLPNPGITDIKIRNDKKIVITAGWDFNIRIFSWKTLKPLAILNLHAHSVQCLAFSPVPIDKKNSVFASGSKNKTIALWSIY